MKKVKNHKLWQLQEAKAKFFKLVDDVIRDGYQTVARNDGTVVVIISRQDFESYRKPKDNLIDFFNRAPLPDVDLDFARDKDQGS